MKPILYFDDRSPPVRGCLMLIKMLNMDVECKFVDLFKGEQFHSDFLKLNPAHTVPTLVDGKTILTDSHAILLHIWDQNRLLHNDKDLLSNSIQVMNMLFLESSLIFRRDSDLMSEIVRKGYKSIDLPYHKRKLHEVYTILEASLKEHTYMAADQLTLADISIVTTLSTVNLMFPIEASEWPLLKSWFLKMQTLPEYEVNRIGLEKLRNTLEVNGNFKFPITVTE